MPMSDEPQQDLGGWDLTRVERGRRGGGSVRVFGMSGPTFSRPRPGGVLAGGSVFFGGKQAEQWARFVPLGRLGAPIGPPGRHRSQRLAYAGEE